MAGLATALLLVSLTACAESDGQPVDKKEVVVQYEGRDLHCISWDGSHSERGLTCDFVRFYNENVEPFVEPSEGPAYEVQ